VSFSEPAVSQRDDARVLLGWMSNWSYAHDVPAGGGHRGAMTLPRVVSLRTVDGRVRLVQHPVAPAGRTAYALESERVVGARPLPVSGARLRLRLEVEPAATGRTGLRVRVGEGQRTEVGYDADAGCVYLDRTAAGESGFAPGFAAVHRAPYPPPGGILRLTVYVDSTSVEVFAGQGEVVLTDLVFPSPVSTGVELLADESAFVRLLEVSDLSPA
jgi:sucrose-6-phosphate hydrolase SacC (GH32 family)